MPTRGNATNRTWPYQLTLPGVAASEPGCRRFEKATQANRDAETADTGLGSESSERRQGTKKHTGRQNIPNFRVHSGDPAAGSRAGNTVARKQHDRGGRMAGACISAGMRCTCLKLRDLVSACESSSSSGSPSGPPASSSPAPEPRTADHVHLAHCTGDRICQGLNAMSAAAAPAMEERRPLPSKWRGLDRRRQRRRRPADVAQRAPSGRAQLPPTAPQRRSPPLLRAAAPKLAPARARSLACLFPRQPCSASLGSGVRSRLEQPRPPRSRAPGAAPSDRTTGAARGGGRLEARSLPPPRWSRPALGRGCSTTLALPAGSAPTARRRRPFPSVCAPRRRSSSPFICVSCR